jgi:hypothetical protein
MQTEKLEPVRILSHKAKDPSLESDAVRVLWSASKYLTEEQGREMNERLALLKEGRL